MSGCAAGTGALVGSHGLAVCRSACRAAAPPSSSSSSSDTNATATTPARKKITTTTTTSATASANPTHRRTPRLAMNQNLLHDGGGTDRDQTMAALPAIISGLRGQGYTLAPLPPDGPG